MFTARRVALLICLLSGNVLNVAAEDIHLVERLYRSCRFSCISNSRQSKAVACMGGAVCGAADQMNNTPQILVGAYYEVKQLPDKFEKALTMLQPAMKQVNAAREQVTAQRKAFEGQKSGIDAKGFGFKEMTEPLLAALKSLESALGNIASGVGSTAVPQKETKTAPSTPRLPFQLPGLLKVSTPPPQRNLALLPCTSGLLCEMQTALANAIKKSDDFLGTMRSDIRDVTAHIRHKSSCALAPT